MLGPLAFSPRVAGLSLGLIPPRPGDPADAQLLHLCGQQFHVLAVAPVRRRRLAMDKTAGVWGTDIHVLASDHGHKAKAIRGSGRRGRRSLGSLCTRLRNWQTTFASWVFELAIP